MDIDFPCKTAKNNRKMMKNDVTRFEMAVHTNDDIYTDTLGQNENRSYGEFFFIFHVPWKSSYRVHQSP